MQFRSVIVLSSVLIAGAQLDQPITILEDHNSSALLVKPVAEDTRTSTDTVNIKHAQQVEESVPSKKQIKEEKFNEDVGKYILPVLKKQQLEEETESKQESEPKQTQEERDNAGLLQYLNSQKSKSEQEPEAKKQTQEKSYDSAFQRFVRNLMSRQLLPAPETDTAELVKSSTKEERQPNESSDTGDNPEIKVTENAAELIEPATKDTPQLSISNDAVDNLGEESKQTRVKEPVPSKDQTKEEKHNEDIGKYIIPELERQQMEEEAKIKEESEPKQTQEEKDNSALLGGLHKRKLAKDTKYKQSNDDLRQAVIIHPNADRSGTTPWSHNATDKDTEQDSDQPKGISARKLELLPQLLAWPTLIVRGPEYLHILCDQLAGAIGINNRGVWLMGIDEDHDTYYWNTKNPWRVTWRKPDALKLTKDPIGMTMSYLQATNLVLLADTFLGNN